MSGPLRGALEQHLARCVRWFGPVEPSWFVFPFSNRRRPINPKQPVTSLKKAWASVCKEAEASCRLHDLRHSFCTKLGEAGVPGKHYAGYETMFAAIFPHPGGARREAIRAVEARFSWGPQSFRQSQGNDAKSDDRNPMKQKDWAVSSAG